MTIIGVYIQWKEGLEVVKQIENDFPCFTDYTILDEEYAEVTINCREEDAKAIEKRLAKWVWEGKRDERENKQTKERE